MVKQGYKSTEIGVIPEDWEVKKLKEIGNFLSTNSLSRDKLNYQNGQIYNIHYGDIHTLFKSHFDINNEIVPFINDDIKLSTVNLVKKGDLIIADASENEDDIGKAIEIINDENNNIVAGLHTLHFRPINQIFYNGFLGHLWKTESMHLNILKEAQGTKVLGISVNRLLDIHIPLPPLAEQEAIATALSDADAWIEHLEQLITKKRLIKQGAMQELLTPPSEELVLSGVEAWDVKKLGEVCEINSGESPSKFTFQKDGVAYLKVDELNNSEKYTFGLNYFIKSEKIIPQGSIIFPKRGASIFLNKIRILGCDSFMDTNLMTLTVSSEIFNEFLYYSLIKFGLDKIADTTSIPQINNKHILPLEFKFPSLSEQERIATILSDMDAELEALEKQLGKAQQIKQGMMQELLTGRVRLLSEL